MAIALFTQVDIQEVSETTFCCRDNLPKHYFFAQKEKFFHKSNLASMFNGDVGKTPSGKYAKGPRGKRSQMSAGKGTGTRLVSAALEAEENNLEFNILQKVSEPIKFLQCSKLVLAHFFKFPSKTCALLSMNMAQSTMYY